MLKQQQATAGINTVAVPLSERVGLYHLGYSVDCSHEFLPLLGFTAPLPTAVVRGPSVATPSAAPALHTHVYTLL